MSSWICIPIGHTKNHNQTINILKFLVFQFQNEYIYVFSNAGI
uniref:Uncharacterized protein n=1 Tax=Anguilla anguilla TaxID=7936 RepID=A0A0E9U289_ANGAN